MPFEAANLSCPVCGRSVTLRADGRCPVCDSDLSLLLSWRRHALYLYDQALGACSRRDWSAAAVLLEESRRHAPEWGECARLLGQVYARLGRSDEAERTLQEARRLGVAVDEALPVLEAGRALGWPWQRPALAGAALLLLALTAVGAYRLGRAGAEGPQSAGVVVVATAVPTAAGATDAPVPTLTATQQPTPLPSPSPTASPTVLPTQAPTTRPTAVPTAACTELADQVRAAWANVPALAYAELQVEVQECTVRLEGTAPTEHLVQLAVAAARRAGAHAVDVRAIQVTATYQVRAGDTLWGIAAMVYDDPQRWLAILAANRDRVADVRGLPVGLMLHMPPEE